MNDWNRGGEDRFSVSLIDGEWVVVPGGCNTYAEAVWLAQAENNRDNVLAERARASIVQREQLDSLAGDVNGLDLDDEGTYREVTS